MYKYGPFVHGLVTRVIVLLNPDERSIVSRLRRAVKLHKIVLGIFLNFIKRIKVNFHFTLVDLVIWRAYVVDIGFNVMSFRVSGRSHLGWTILVLHISSCVRIYLRIRGVEH